MAVHRIIHRQQLTADLPTVWRYFTHAANLQTITPEYMHFRVTSGDLPDEIYPGMIITYTIAPVLRIPMFWMTEIRHVQPMKLFVDEQRRGPYKLWHHQHHFEERDGGVLMTDIVHYELPFWVFGTLAHGLFVERQLTNIFEFRKRKLAALFP